MLARAEQFGTCRQVHILNRPRIQFTSHLMLDTLLRDIVPWRHRDCSAELDMLLAAANFTLPDMTQRIGSTHSLDTVHD